MINKETLKEIILANEDFILNQVKRIIRRENIIFPKKLNKVVVLYGVRRSGKTYILFDLFKRHKDSSLYIDFEDERLSNFEVGDFEVLREVFLELKPHLIGKELVFLFDEVQNVKSWEKFCRKAVERENIKVFVTGSSSKMMPIEIQTSLRGRSWSIEVKPFSFKEYLSIKGIDLTDRGIVYGPQKVLLKKYFSEYVKWGGFPEVTLSVTEFEKRKVIEEYLEAMFFRDLVERFNTTNIHLVKVLMESLFSSFASKFSLTAFYKQFKEKFPFSKDTLFSYYNYFLESMLVFETKKFSKSFYKRNRNPAKVYLIDVGICRRPVSLDLGRILENIVFLEMRCRKQEIFYFEEKKECDFVVRYNDGNFYPCQVTWNLGGKNEEREIDGLIEACRRLNVKKGVIFTYDDEKNIEIGKIDIRVLPVWKWLIKNEEF